MFTNKELDTHTQLEKWMSFFISSEAECRHVPPLRVDIKLKKGSFPAAELTLNSHNKASQTIING